MPGLLESFRGRPGSEFGSSIVNSGLKWAIRGQYPHTRPAEVLKHPPWFTYAATP